MSLALVLGGAASVWTDTEAALSLTEFDAVIACNEAAAVWPGRLDAAVSLHAQKFGPWMNRRAELGYPPALRILGHNGSDAQRLPACVTGLTDYRFAGQRNSGSSGLFALKVALIDLGIDRAIVCGIPMGEDGCHFFDARPWRGATSHRRGWNQALPLIRDRARSMGGWTQSLLGAPDGDWIEGASAA